MDLDQIIKRLDWLDDERRRDKTIIATLEERLSSYEGQIPGLVGQIRDTSAEISRITVILARFEQIDASIAQMKVEYSRAIEAIEKQRAEASREVEKVRRADMEVLNKQIADVRKGLDPIPELKKSIQLRTEEDFRLGRLLEEQKLAFDENQRSEEEYRRAIRLIDDGRRQDAKRITDLQGEVSALRKRADEQRGKVDLVTEGVRKVELRIAEFQASEIERRQNQTAFIDKQNMMQVERDRSWKEWESRFEDINRQSAAFDAQMQVLDAALRTVKRSQEAFEDITQRFERRINEITEMQRLVEERFRQEWNNFKNDDQKRWSNFTLIREEQQRDISRRIDKQDDRLVVLEDLSQESIDGIQRINDEISKRLQGLLTLSHQWVEEYNQQSNNTRS